MKKYQYKYKVFKIEAYESYDRYYDKLDEMLNSYGEQGYEIEAFDVENYEDREGKRELTLHVIFKKEKG